MENKKILERIRKLNWLLSESTVGYVAFNELCQVIADMLEANVYILSKRGKSLAAVREAGGGTPLVEKEGRVILPKKYNDRILKVEELKVNLAFDDVKELYGPDYDDDSKFHIIEPIVNCGNRIATMIVARPDVVFDEEDIVICELAATIVGMEVAKGLAEEAKEDVAQKKNVALALDRLSYSEIQAVVKIFDELRSDETLLVASKVADKYDITRSVIVNALRKLESAGLIETRSLGMKGTRIKVMNDYLREEIAGFNI